MQFPFPYHEPYQVQKGFMNDLYTVIESGKIGLFESPTGTGKSLSLICGAMKWIKDNQSKDIDQIVEEKMTEYRKNETLNPKDPQWLIDQKRKRIAGKFRQNIIAKRNQERERKELLDRLRNEKPSSISKRLKAHDKPYTTSVDKIQDNLLNDYNSDEDLKTVYLEKPDEDDPSPKIIYASRTHSQISQFINEIKKTSYSNSRVVTLGSRKTLCLNEEVNSMKNLANINDACLDLQGKKNCCPYRRPDSDQDNMALSEFSLHIEAVIRDIEEIGLLGKELHTCPYYGTRSSISNCDIICLPYNLLLHKSARESCGINLKNSIIIIDESHNIIDAINSIHSIVITDKQLSDGREQLSNYYEKYKTKLAPKNSLYIKQLMLLISRLNALEVEKNKMHLVPTIISALQLEHINLFKIIRFIEISKLANKLHGFYDKVANATSKPLKHDSPLRAIDSLLKALAYPDEDGRILISSDENGFNIKYLLLNPSNVFQELVQSSKSLILAGGTMSPIDDIINQLLPSVPIENIHHFKCGHVIPLENLLPIAISSGPKGIPLNFSFKTRFKNEVIMEAGYALLNLCQIVPKGIIVFFPSYSYMEKVIETWKMSDVLNRISQKKYIFIEATVTCDGEEDLLSGYSRAVNDPQRFGAILFAVVGGKMSEGINFSDDLGRAVIMIGLPFANLHSIELIEKMKYLDSQKNGNGKEYYENLCMKAVNQSIGRAIRHGKDFSTIILMDERYLNPKLVKKLPNWILDCNIPTTLQYSECLGKIKNFFNHFQPKMK